MNIDSKFKWISLKAWLNIEEKNVTFDTKQIKFKDNYLKSVNSWN